MKWLINLIFKDPTNIKQTNYDELSEKTSSLLNSVKVRDRQIYICSWLFNRYNDNIYYIGPTFSLIEQGTQNHPCYIGYENNNFVLKHVWKIGVDITETKRNIFDMDYPPRITVNRNGVYLMPAPILVSSWQ